jgi:hypothetical protein
MAVALAEAINKIDVGHWKDTHFSNDQIQEIRYASLLSKIGMICVRERVRTKAKKLSNEQLEIIRLRFACARSALEADYSRRQLNVGFQGDQGGLFASFDTLNAELREKLVGLDQDLQAVIAANEPAVLNPEVAERIRALALRTYDDGHGQSRRFSKSPRCAPCPYLAAP